MKEINIDERDGYWWKMNVEVDECEWKNQEKSMDEGNVCKWRWTWMKGMSVDESHDCEWRRWMWVKEIGVRRFVSVRMLYIK